MAQMRELLPDAVTVAVKAGRGRGVAGGLHPAEACRWIRASAAETVRRRREIRPAAVPNPMVTEIDCFRTGMAQTIALVPGVERIGPRSLCVAADADAIFRLQRLLVYRLRYELPRRGCR